MVKYQLFEEMFPCARKGSSGKSALSLRFFPRGKFELLFRDPGIVPLHRPRVTCRLRTLLLAGGMSMNGQELFVHVLLFTCPNCSRPIGVTHTANERNVEKVDGRSFDCRYQCQWHGQIFGANARRHWVESWDASQRAAEFRK